MKTVSDIKKQTLRARISLQERDCEQQNYLKTAVHEL